MESPKIRRFLTKHGRQHFPKTSSRKQLVIKQPEIGWRTALIRNKGSFAFNLSINDQDGTTCR